MLCKTLYLIIGSLWIGLMLLMPSQFSLIKMCLLLILLIINVLEIIIKRISINKNMILGVLITVILGFAYILYGSINGYKIDYKLIEMYIFTPISAILLSNIVKKEKDLISLYNILLIITLIIVIYDFIYILSSIGILPNWLKFESSIGGSIKISNDFIEARMSNHSSLMFLLPMVICGEIVILHKIKFFKKIGYITIFLGLIVVMLSGRRALQLVTMLSVLISFISIKYTRIRIKKEVIKGVIIISVITIIGGVLLGSSLADKLGLMNPLKSIKETFFEGFDFNNTTSGIIRKQQTDALIKGWYNNTFFGQGIGSYAKDCIRSSSTPWSYEMVYISFLHQFGIIGVIIYFGLVINMCICIINKAKINKKISAYYLSFFVGMVCFLIAGATNPMVFYIWAWAICLACINTKIES